MFERPRRNRKSGVIRNMVRETHLQPAQLIQPIFMTDGDGIKEEIKSLPGQYRRSYDQQIPLIEECMEHGISQFILFPVVDESLKDPQASYSYAADNFYLRDAAKMKKKYGDKICLVSDVAMDPYSSDGHDGLVQNGKILNDATLDILGRMAVAQAQAGFDIIGPSDMMDGRVAYIRDALDEAGFSEVGIMSYTAKYASAFYGPFRDALDSAPKAGDKKTYQMDPANRQEALREARLDLHEGADYLMVKPALHYMDIISDLKVTSDIPIVCYHVSGECAMLLAAAEKGWLKFEDAMPEALLSLKRAGADIIITYFALDFAKMVKDRS